MSLFPRDWTAMTDPEQSTTDEATQTDSGEAEQSAETPAQSAE